MANILFITTEYLKTNTAIDDNIDNSILTPYITQAQKIHIEPILGTVLYKKLQADITAGSVTGVYKTLLDDYIQNTLAYWTMYDSLPFLNYKVTNKSIVTKGSETSAAIGLDELRYLHANIRDNAEYLSQRITKYLVTNQSSFSEYRSNSEIDEIRPNSTSYFSGIYLGNGSNNDCNDGLGLGIELN